MFCECLSIVSLSVLYLNVPGKAGTGDATIRPWLGVDDKETPKSKSMLAAREMNDLSTEYSHRPQDPNILNLMMMRKQARKVLLVTRGTVSNQLNAGREAEAVESLAGMSFSVFRGGVTSSERPRPLGIHAESRQRPVGNFLVPRSPPSIECRSMGSRLGIKPVRGSSGRSGSSAAYIPVRRDASGW